MVAAVSRGAGGPHVVYGMYTDSQNNLFFADFGGEAIGRIDAKTAEVALFMTPPAGMPASCVRVN